MKLKIVKPLLVSHQFHCLALSVCQQGQEIGTRPEDADVIRGQWVEAFGQAYTLLVQLPSADVGDS
jgi:hypothetical protein